MENEKHIKAKESCKKYYGKVNEGYLSDYADELNKKAYDKVFLERFSTYLKEGERLLDIGCCSSAQQARFFSENGYDVTAIDLSEECIQTAKSNFKGIEFLQMDMTEMKFEDDLFDAVNAFYSIIHIPNERIEKLFLDFNRILKVKGKLAIAVHAGDFYGYYEESEVPVFYRTYTQQELVSLLDRAGFDILHIDQRKPIYDFEFQSERIYLIAEKV